MNSHHCVRLILVILLCSLNSLAQQNSVINSSQSGDPVVLLHRLVGHWDVFASTRLDSSIGNMRVVPVAKGRGVFSTFKFGENDNPSYEANSIWAYDSILKKVFAYEVNSLGAVFTHIGAFTSEGSLQLFRYDKSDTSAILQESLLTWMPENSMVFSAIFATDKGRRKSTWVFKKVQ